MIRTDKLTPDVKKQVINIIEESVSILSKLIIPEVVESYESEKNDSMLIEEELEDRDLEL